MYANIENLAAATQNLVKSINIWRQTKCAPLESSRVRVPNVFIADDDGGVRHNGAA